ncbi:MAG TPA: polysaccharide deacetylase family protein [Gemmatimonadales bacterium]|nr:polysaccharide deacetylase family protein [Gemmatimonadales bacterium]
MASGKPLSGPAIAGLMYHAVTDDPRSSGFQRPGALPYTLTRAAFQRHLDTIARGPIQPQLVTDLGLGTTGNNHARHLLLTFDDGGASAMYVAEELARRQWKAHFFIITGRIGERTFLKPDEIRAIRSMGHLVGTHSHTHPDIFRNLPRELMATEWRVSRAILEGLLGEPCCAASVPGGDISRVVLESVAESGMRYVFTSEPLLTPARVGDTWILGRVILKAGVTAATIRELIAFRGWQRAQLLRRLGGIARALFPPLYAQYVRLRTRERQS